MMQSADGSRPGFPGVKFGYSGEWREKDHVAAWAFGIAAERAILKDRIEQELLKYQPGEQCKASTWAEALSNVLKEMEDDRELFTRLFRSYPSRLAGVKKTSWTSH